MDVKFKNNIQVELGIFAIALIGYMCHGGRFIVIAILAEIIKFTFEIRKNISKNIIIIMYVFSFSIFLLTVPFLDFFNKEFIENYGQNIEAKSIFCVFLALQFCLLGWKIANINKTRLDNDKNIETNKLKVISNISFVLSLCTFPFMCLVQIERLIVVFSGEYVDLYTFQSSYGFLIHKISVAFLIFTMIFISTSNEKKRCNIIMILYTIYLLLDLLTGRRGVFVTGIFLILTYYAFKINVNDTLNHKLIKKWFMGVCCILGVIVVLLGYIGGVRQKDGREGYSVMETIEQQGATYLLICDVIENKDVLSSMNANYSLFSVINNKECFKKIYNNFVTIDDSKDWRLTNNNLGNAITYLKDDIYFENGGSFGTSYIAELYVDYGYIGIVIYSLILGILIAEMQNTLFKNWIITTYSFLILNHLYFLPRESCFNPWVQILSISNLVIIMFIYILGCLLTKFRNYKME